MVPFGMVIIFFSDVIRQFHFSFNCYISACVIELCNFGLTALSCYFFSTVLNWGYIGILIAFLESQTLVLCAYILNYTLNPNFQVDGKRFVRICAKPKSIEAEESNNNENIEQNLNDESNMDEVEEKFDKFSNY